MKINFSGARQALHSIDIIIGNLQSTAISENLFVIWASLFDEDKNFMLIDVPLCENRKFF